MVSKATPSETQPLALASSHTSSPENIGKLLFMPILVSPLIETLITAAISFEPIPPVYRMKAIGVSIEP